jgi:hypothetical protein
VFPLTRSTSRSRFFGLPFSPSVLFAAGEQGVWYDPSDFSTLFQNAAGTTPVTAVEQPVRLMLDKSKGLVLGSDVVTNGTFTGGGTGWAPTTSGTGTVTFASDKCTITSPTGDDAYITQSCLTAGKWYKISFNLVVRGGGVQFFFGVTDPAATVFSTSGNIEFIEYAYGPTLIIARSAAGADIDIDNVVIRELPGNHALAPSDLARPVLRARYNLLTYSEEFDNAAWNKTLFPVTVTQNAEVAPNGTATADLMLEQATTANHGCYNATAISPTVTGVSYTYSVYAKTAGRSFLIIDAFTNANAYTWFDLSTGQVGTNAAGNTASIISVGNGWYRCSVQRAATATLNHFIGIYAAPSDNTASYAGDVTKGLYIWGADLRVTNDALNQPAYQRVGAASDYDTNGFLPFLVFDGSDDAMSTSAINFSGTDKMTVFAGVRKLSDDLSILLEQSVDSDANAGTVQILISAANTYRFRSRGTGSSANGIASALTSFPAPITNVVTGIGDISGDVSQLRVNASVIATTTNDQGSGNYGNYPVFIGSQNITSLRFNGRIYSLIIRGAASSAAEIAATEAYINARTGAY